jgi:hypothetical protein
MDISHQKRAEQLQAQRLEDVLETKRQSENFIDGRRPYFLRLVDILTLTR